MNETGLLHEDIMLLILLDGDGRPVFGSMSAYPLLVEGAILTELVLRERIHIDGHWNVQLLSPATIGDPVLDAALRAIAERPDERSIAEWFSLLHERMNAPVRILRVLLERGDIQQRSKSFLGIMPVPGYAAGESERWDGLHHRLDQVARGDILMDDRLFATLCLLSATPLLGALYPRRQKDLRRRLKKIVREIASFDPEESGPEIVQRMINLAMIAGAVAASGTEAPALGTSYLAETVVEEADE